MNIIGIIIVVLICAWVISLFVREGLKGGSSCSNTVLLWLIILIIAAVVIYAGYDAIVHPNTPYGD